MLILVTNDDGIRSPGLLTLAEAMKTLGEVVVVAPDRNRSAVGHALTLDHPLRADLVEDNHYAVDGTPSDCVNLGIHGLLRCRPDLVVSGINCGSNLGDDITYSGTVSAALEANLMGLPAFAVSLDVSSFNRQDLAVAGEAAALVARKILTECLEPGVFLNVNVPSGGASGMKLTRQGRRRYGEAIVVNRDPRGRAYYWLGGEDLGYEDIPGTDCMAIQQGLVSVTPLHADMTHENSLTTLNAWLEQEGFSR